MIERRHIWTRSKLGEENGNITEEDAQVIGTERDRLRMPTPAEFVEASRPEEAPCHKFFEWKDWWAAELYRRGQARLLFRSVERVEFNLETGEEESRGGLYPVPPRVLERVKFQEVAASPPLLPRVENGGKPIPDGGHRFLDSDQVKSSKGTTKYVIGIAFRLMLSFRSRFKRIQSELEQDSDQYKIIFDAIDQLEREQKDRAKEEDSDAILESDDDSEEE